MEDLPSWASVSLPCKPFPAKAPAEGEVEPFKTGEASSPLSLGWWGWTVVVTLFIDGLCCLRHLPCCPELAVLACSPGLVGEVADAGPCCLLGADGGVSRTPLVPSGQSEWVLIPEGDPWLRVLGL